MSIPLPAKASNRTIRSWIFYDFANSSFTTIVVTFIYATYFSNVIATEGDGLSLWGDAISISAVIIAIISPFMGAMADRGGHRKRFLVISTVVCILGSIVLYFPLPGQIVFALGTFVVANVAFEMANVFYNAYLPDIAPMDKIGKVSGQGWAVGYIGGLLCMIAGYYILVAPDVPPFGLSAETGSNVRATTLLVAIWYSLFSIPMFLWVKDPVVESPPSMWSLMKAAQSELIHTFKEIRRFKHVFRLLLARLLYNDGLITIFALSAIYAGDQFGIDPFVLGITLNVAAGAGAYAMGYLDDYIGGKITILISIVGLTIAVFVAVVTYNIVWFWAALFLGAILAGPNQAASRSLFGRFVPENRETEFYGFYAFSGKMTSFMGPLLVANFARMFDSDRVGFSTIIILFIVGGAILLTVNEKEGMRSAGNLVEEPV